MNQLLELTVSEKERGLLNNKWFVRIAVVVLLLSLTIQAVLSMRQKSVTVDEIMYIAAGYYHIKTGDFQYNMTNPPFMKVVSALPLLAVNPDLPGENIDPSEWNLFEQWQHARSFLYENRVDADTMLFLSRLSIIAVSIVLGLYIFFWGRELYGVLAGLFALFLYSFSPNILAHTRLATQDIGLTAFILIATYYFWKYSKDGALTWLLLCGFFFGLAAITKTVAFIVFPIFALYGLIILFQYPDRFTNSRLPFVGRIPSDKVRLRQLATLTGSLLVIGLLGLVIINLGYGLQGAFRPLSADFLEKIYGRFPLFGEQLKALDPMLKVAPVPLPWPFVRSLAFQFRLVGESAGIYFAGNLFENGLWYLMPASFLIKTPLPTLIMIILAGAFLVIRRMKLDAELLMLLVIFITLTVFVIFSSTILGLRYILPIYPFLFLLIGSVLNNKYRLSKVIAASLAVLSILYVLGTARIYPHYLAYFNELIGGPENGYKYLADSSLDWGQDLKGLKVYMDKNEIDMIKLAYYGSADADYYDIDYEFLPSMGLSPKEPGQSWWYEIDPANNVPLEPQKGILAVSTTILASPRWMHPLFSESYAWLKNYEPIDQVGYSILIYEIE